MTSVALLTFVEVVGTAALGHWAKTDGDAGLVGGICLFAVLGYVLAWSIRLCHSMNIVNALWQSFTIICVAFTSIFVFREPITAKQAAGVVFAAAASVCFVT